MAIVTYQMLHRHMSEPRWTAAQQNEADRLCAGVEADLEASLYGAVITPRERTESAPVSRDGLVDTTLPVNRVLELDGAALAEDAPLPDGYDLRAGRLYTSRPLGDTYHGAVAVGWPWVAPVDLTPPFPGGVLRIRYLGGWGADPALVEAILRKAAARMGGRHSDTMVVTGLNAQAPPSREPTHWTPEDLAALSRFRNLGWGSRR